MNCCYSFRLLIIMVHFLLGIAENTEFPTILFTKLNESKTKAAAYLLFRDHGKLKCEYFVTSQTFQDTKISSTVNLNSALEFWQDILCSVQGSVYIISDVDEKLKSRGIRITFHQIKLKRLGRNPPIKEFYLDTHLSQNLASNISKTELHAKQLLIHIAMEKLFQGCNGGLDSFKDVIQKVTNRTIQFTRVT